MLLTKESHAIQYLPRSGAGSVEPLPQIGVFSFQFFDALRIELCAARCRVDRFYPSFCLQRPSPEARELDTKVAHEPLQLFECFTVRTF
jgi:hypothetical protein